MAQKEPIKLTANIIAGFVNKYLLSKYESPVAIPPVHREWWDLILNGKSRVALAAPRKHAKSTAITHAMTLALLLFRHKKYAIIVSEVQAQAIQFLGDIKLELTENEQLRKDFKVRKIVKDAETDCIFEFEDGEQFRICAFGAEQRVRGRKWRGTRPDWIVCDDIEGDEQVDSDLRREKFRNWVFKALLPIRSTKGQVVIVGTILHLDSLLMRLMKHKNTWTSKLYKAHKGFDDFTERLWPEQWSEEALREERQVYIEDGNGSGYAQEYLNDPVASDDQFFKESDFKEIEEEMRLLPTENWAGVDLAISDEDKRAYSVITVGGMDSFRRLLIKAVIRFRGDAYEIINNMMEVQRIYNIQGWKVESGQIEKTLKGPLLREMEERGIYLNLIPGVPTKDKRSRARAIQARMRAGGVYFDTHAEWFPGFKQELIHFPKGEFKDQVDSLAWLGIALNEIGEGPTNDEVDEERYEEEMEQYREETGNLGICSTTGY